MNWDSVGCTFLCSASLEECHLTRFLGNLVGQFVHPDVEKGLGRY